MSGITDRLVEGAEAIAHKAADLTERIRERAHAIWEREGRPHGRDEDHWKQAQQEIADEDAVAPAEPAAPKPARRTAAKPKATAAAKSGEGAAPRRRTSKKTAE